MTFSKAWKKCSLFLPVIGITWLALRAEDGIVHSTWQQPANLATQHMPHWSTWLEIDAAISNREDVFSFYWGNYDGFFFPLSLSNHPTFKPVEPALTWLMSGWVDYTRANSGDLSAAVETNSGAFPTFDGARLAQLGITNLATNSVLVSSRNARDWRAVLELMRAVELTAFVVSNSYYNGFGEGSSIAAAKLDAEANAVSTPIPLLDTFFGGGSWSYTTDSEGCIAMFQRGKRFIAAEPGNIPSNIVGTVELYAVSSRGPLENFYGYGLAQTNWQKVASQAGRVIDLVFTYGSDEHAPDWCGDNQERGYDSAFKLLFRGDWNP